jgi:hypothetical protein
MKTDDVDPGWTFFDEWVEALFSCFVLALLWHWARDSVVTLTGWERAASVTLGNVFTVSLLVWFVVVGFVPALVKRIGR